MTQSPRRALGRRVALRGAAIVLGVFGAGALSAAPAGAQDGAKDRGARALGIDTTNFDRSVRPQDDLFRFVNGGWLTRTEIPGDASSWGAFN